MFSKFSSKCFYFYYSPRQKHGVLNSVQKIRELNFSSLIAILILFSLFYIESSSVTDFGVSAMWWFKGLRSFFWVWCAQHAAAPCRLLPGQLCRQQQTKRLRTSWRHRFHVLGLQEGQGEQAACWGVVTHQAQLLRFSSLPPAPSSPARGKSQLNASALPQHCGPTDVRPAAAQRTTATEIQTRRTGYFPRGGKPKS